MRSMHSLVCDLLIVFNITQLPFHCRLHCRSCAGGSLSTRAQPSPGRPDVSPAQVPPFRRRCCVFLSPGCHSAAWLEPVQRQRGVRKRSAERRFRGRADERRERRCIDGCIPPPSHAARLPAVCLATRSDRRCTTALQIRAQLFSAHRDRSARSESQRTTRQRQDEARSGMRATRTRRERTATDGPLRLRAAAFCLVSLRFSVSLQYCSGCRRQGLCDRCW